MLAYTPSAPPVSLIRPPPGSDPHVCSREGQLTVSIVFDTGKAVRTSAERQRLVHAVYQAPPNTSEPTWVEWKSALVLSEPEAILKIVRNILGMANRQPDAASNEMEGCGYVLGGVEPGGLDGVTEIDHALIHDALSPYLGINGPRWDFTYEHVQGVSVLVVQVEAPRWGDPIYTLRKTFGKYANGTVFVRRPGKVEAANSDDIERLTERARRGAAPLQMEIGWVGNPYAVRVEDPMQNGEAWLAAEADILLSSLPAEVPGVPSFGAISSFSGDVRSSGRYRQEVAAYIYQARPMLEAMLARAAYDRAAELRLILSNPTDKNFSQVQVEVRTPSGSMALTGRDDLPTENIPRRPKPFGKKTVFMSDIPILPGMARYAARTAWIDPADSTRMLFAPIDLRPFTHATLPEFRVVCAAFAPESLTLRWQASATNSDGAVAGELALPVDARSVTLDDLNQPSAS